jgi:hypothetical protein
MEVDCMPNRHRSASRRRRLRGRAAHVAASAVTSVASVGGTVVDEDAHVNDTG